MTAVLFLHMACVSVWLACVLAETAWERGPNPSDFVRRLLSRVHRRIDFAIELPAFLGVLLTGGLMAGNFPMAPLLALKMATGLIALGVNVHCVLLVRQRAPAKQASNFWRWQAIDPSRRRYGAVALIALAFGTHMFVG